MARTAGSDGERTEAAIREAAAQLIARHGFEAVTMRQLAAATTYGALATLLTGLVVLIGAAALSIG